MTQREFRKLYAIPYDIERRKLRIEKLERIQADGPQSASDVVRSSRGEGNACVLGHATVTGTDIAFSRREEEIRLLKKKNCEQLAEYTEAVRLVENCDDVELRAMLSAVCIEGKKPQEVAVELMESGIDVDPETIRKRIERWIKKQARQF